VDRDSARPAHCPSAAREEKPRVARELPIDVVLSTGSGFGGFQSAIVLARAKEPEPVA